MQLFLGAVPIILRLFSKARGHLLFSNYSRNNLPKPTHGTGHPHVELYQFCVTVQMSYMRLHIIPVWVSAGKTHSKLVSPTVCI